MAKSKYYTHVEPRLVEIEGWARDGLTDEQIAKNLGIGVRTLYEYKEKYPQIVQSLKRGKEVVDREVENALLKRALGYKYQEITQEPVMNHETGVYELQPTKVVTKEVAPDTTAQIFWLKNRKPKEWRDRKDVEHSGTINNPFANLSEEDLLKIVEKEQ